MQIRPSDLGRRLQGGFPAAFLVVGDEPLLVEEACDEILAAAKREGFAERALFEAAPRAPWQDLFADAANLSLFASKRLLDVRIPARGLDRAGSDAVRGYLDQPLDDTLLLCRAVALEWRQRTAAWFKALDAKGVVVPLAPVSARELPRWLEGRCRAAGLRLERDAIALIADRVEGNLLAGQQEIEKLKLLQADGPLSVDEVTAAVGDSSHFDAFALIDAAFAGQAARVRRMLSALALQGVAVFLILAALANQLQRAREVAAGGHPRLPPSRARALAASARRLGVAGVDRLIEECALLDQQAKGMLRGDAWQSLESLLLALAGAKAPALADAAPLLAQR